MYIYLVKIEHSKKKEYLFYVEAENVTHAISKLRTEIDEAEDPLVDINNVTSIKRVKGINLIK